MTADGKHLSVALPSIVGRSGAAQLALAELLFFFFYLAMTDNSSFIAGGRGSVPTTLWRHAPPT